MKVNQCLVLSKQVSFANTTLSSKSRTSTGIPPSLSAFMRSFIAPKLKKSHWRNVRGPRATLPTFRSCADIFIALAFKSSSIARKLKSTSPANLRKQPTFHDATAGSPAKWRLRNKRRNSILMMRHHPDLGSAFNWLKQVSHAAWPIRSTTQIWIVSRRQFGISALVSQTSFRRGDRWWRHGMSAVFSGYSPAESSHSVFISESSNLSRQTQESRHSRVKKVSWKTLG